MPLEFQLSQNYPNPFNATTNIEYVIKNNCRVVITVYNVRGQKLTTLVNANQYAGKYRVQWDASNRSSGLYFFKIQAGNFVDIKKSILIK